MSALFSTERRIVTGLWAGLAVWFAGRLVDARWHSEHDEFEGASQQLEAHWLAWLGVLVTVALAIWGARHFGELRRSLGLRILIAGGALYALVAVWHFIEHAGGSDPEAAHVLLVLANAALLVGAVVATASLRRGRERSG
jgi:hypothetical protein